MRGLVSVLAGLVAGFAFGLAWGAETRKRLSESVQTSVSGGVLTVTVDAKTAATEGLSALLNRF